MSSRGARGWQYDGRVRPPFAIEPGPGEESVWDYPRPPQIEPDAREVVVRVGDIVVARSRRAVRVLETASPPTVYLPHDDVVVELLSAAGGSSFCEWKGAARYWTVQVGAERLEAVAWSYDEPPPPFTALRGHVSFYPGRIACFLGGVRVQPQPGQFYGGWITPGIVGPFKGEPGTWGW
jgi:uncharacterized protein (DUF427 family)